MTKPCTQCGRCCTNAEFMQRLSVCATDVARWKAHDRQDILSKLDHETAWATSGPCPFVAQGASGRYTCTIYDTRPLICRDYPNALAHMEYVDCEMLEPGDTDATVAAFMTSNAAAA